MSALVDRVKAILLKPAEEWGNIAGESTSIADVAKGHVLPLILIGPVATLIGLSVIGMDLGLLTYRVPIGTSISVLVASLIGAVVALGILTLIAEYLAPQFGGTANRINAFKLIAYSMTAGWVASALMIVPALAIIVLLASFYGFYILYLGTGPMMKVPAEKSVIYTVVLLICGFVAQYIVNRLAMSMAMPSGPMGLSIG